LLREKKNIFFGKSKEVKPSKIWQNLLRKHGAKGAVLPMLLLLLLLLMLMMMMTNAI
jgi:hypothetical protein